MGHAAAPRRVLGQPARLSLDMAAVLVPPHHRPSHPAGPADDDRIWNQHHKIHSIQLLPQSQMLVTVPWGRGS